MITARCRFALTTLSPRNRYANFGKQRAEDALSSLPPREYLTRRKGSPGKSRTGGFRPSGEEKGRRAEDGDGVPEHPHTAGGEAPRGGHRQTSGVAGRGAGPSPLAVPCGAVPRSSLTSCSEQRKMSVQRPVQQPMVAAGEPPPLLARPSRVGAAPEAKPCRRGSPHPDSAAAAPSPPLHLLSLPPLLLCEGRRRAARPRGGAAGGGGLCPAAGKGQGPGVGVCGAGREGRRREGRCGRDGGDGRGGGRARG